MLVKKGWHALGNMTEAMRGLSTLGHLSLLLLIPILIGVFGGIWLDEQLVCSPVCVIIGTLIGIIAAFRNLYMWSMRQIAQNNKSERVQRAIRESGIRIAQDKEEDERGGAE